MDKRIILHIPHSSTNIPLSEGYLVDYIALEKEILKLTDWYTDDLFYSNEAKRISCISDSGITKKEINLIVFFKDSNR
tara:strand:+ start:77 stop:310 length:234 start_codon:yes stop_codon:yes gene_type:complete